MPHDRAPTASVIPPAVARAPLVIRYDLSEASQNITELTDELADDGRNARYVARRIVAEMQWIGDLLEELADAARP